MNRIERVHDRFSSIENLKSMFPDLGITRLGNLTGLDTLNIPVWFASRPNSRGLSVAQGKGCGHPAAQIGAVMEAAESAIAENHEALALRLASLDEMENEGLPVVPLGKLSRCGKRAVIADVDRAWIEGFQLGTGDAVFAPYELIGMDMRPNSGWDYDSFQMSSVGLAAGASRDGAIEHALLELIENDNSLLNEMFGLNPPFAMPVHYQRGQYQALDAQVDRVRQAGIMPYFYNLRGAVDLPVIACFLKREINADSKGSERVEGGVACRLCAGDAALAALSEAAQTRLVNIAGVRDDLMKSSFEINHAALSKPGPDAPQLCSIVSGSADDNRAPVDAIVAALAAVGIEEIFVFPLTPPESRFHVVRVLVPHLVSGATQKVVNLAAHHLAWMEKMQ